MAIDVRGHTKLLVGILVRTVVLALALGLCSDRLARWAPVGGSESTYRESEPRELDVVPRAARWHTPVAPAPLLKRLPVPAAESWNGAFAAAQQVWPAPESIVPSCTGVEIVRVTRHVPRMDCGEPPRA